MAKIIDDIKSKIYDEFITETKLDNIMAEFNYLPVENDDADEIIKYSNGRSQIWIDVIRDEENNVVIGNIRQVTKEEGETEVDPFHSFKDLKMVLDYFYEKKKYHHWLNALLQTLLGRRVNDICSLRFSVFYNNSGELRDRLRIKEEKTGKIVRLKQPKFVQETLNHYCEIVGVNPIDHYNEPIFSIQAQSFRKALKLALKDVGIKYDASCHSFRKFFGNQLYKLHPNDPDRIKIIQYLFGHSSEEITRKYIATIDEKMEKYMDDFSIALKTYLEGNEYEVDNSPVVHFRTQDIRKIVSDIYLKGKQSALGNDGKSDIDIINELVTEMEKIRIQMV